MVVKKGTLSVSLYEGAPSTIYTVWEFIEDVENLIVMRNEAFPSEQAKAYAGIDVSEIASIFDSAQYPDPICTWDVELTPVSEESESVDVNLIPNASVDCNLVDTSGKLYNMFFRDSDETRNFPIRINGWLETMVYSSDTNYRTQRYTTYKGVVYERNMIDGVWTAWARQMRQYVLFNNDSASLSGSVTLSESAANFDKLTIMYRSNDNYFASIDVWNPNGKYVVLTSSSYTSVSNVILKSKTIYISGTSITTHHNSSNFYYTGEAAVNGNQPTTHKDSVCVTQVIGWK